MKNLIVCLLAFFFIVASAQAQFKLEITKEMKKSQAEITVSGKTFDEVWNGCIKALMGLKFKIKERDKDSGLISAEKRPGIFYEKGDEVSICDLMIEEADGKVVITYTYTLGTDALSTKEPFKHFCEKLRELLSDSE